MKRRGIKNDDHLMFEEILLDSSNLPSFDTGRMEGRIELPLARRNMYIVLALFVLITLVFSGRLFQLQVLQGAEFKGISERNRISQTLLIAERGIVYDRNGELVAWNERDHTDEYSFPVRAYSDRKGIGQLIGYVSYPQKDSAGFYYRTEYVGRNGIEQTYDNLLAGKNGERLVEVNALGEIISENVVRTAEPGKEVTLSVDIELSEAIHDLIATTSNANGFRGGAGVVMDVHTGEIIAMSSYPSYDPEVMADGDDQEQINQYTKDTRLPFLNRVHGGLFVPGSIVKPFMAYAALTEGVITENTVIASYGQLVVPNRYDPSNPTIFKDWRSQGEMTVRDALAYSSNVFFYVVGGGFEDQLGLGITRIVKYMKLFGLDSSTGIALGGEQVGVVPSPEWKQEIFNDDWRLGDTYLTSIGQFGFQVSPLAMVRAYGALATGGTLITPHLIKGEVGTKKDIELEEYPLSIVQDGLRRTVIQDRGTARPLERDDVEVAGKSGTAELGRDKSRVNSWIAGYWPINDPQYSFVLFMEDGPRENTVGASRVMGWVFDWMAEHRPEYLQIEGEKSESISG